MNAFDTFLNKNVYFSDLASDKSLEEGDSSEESFDPSESDDSDSEEIYQCSSESLPSSRLPSSVSSTSSDSLHADLSSSSDEDGEHPLGAHYIESASTGPGVIRPERRSLLKSESLDEYLPALAGTNTTVSYTSEDQSPQVTTKRTTTHDAEGPVVAAECETGAGSLQNLQPPKHSNR